MTDQEIRAKALECALYEYRSRVFFAGLKLRSGQGWTVRSNLEERVTAMEAYIRDGLPDYPPKMNAADIGVTGTWPEGAGE